MNTKNNLLSQKDHKLLCKFRIKKEVRISIIKLQISRSIKVISGKAGAFLLGPECDFDSIVKTQVEIHTKGGHKAKVPFKCGFCQYSGRTKQHLVQHERTHSTYRRYKCTQCSYGANNTGHLKRHVYARHNSNPEGRKRNFPCQLCSKSFYVMWDLRQHLSTHTREKPFSCQFCNKSFAKNGDKKSHEIICKKNPKQSDSSWVQKQKRFKCNLCCTKWRLKSSLTSHMKIHLSEKPFKCKLCDYAGTSARLVKDHQTRMHDPNNIEYFQCKLCPKTFLTNSELKVHIQRHTKEKPFECTFCKKQFPINGDRRRHMVTCKLNPKQNDKSWVDAQKRFKCNLCEYSARDRYKIKRHQGTHTRHRQLKCALCEHTCSDSSGLNVHMMTHTGERPVRCPHCTYGSVNKYQLSMHIKRRHKLST